MDRLAAWMMRNRLLLWGLCLAIGGIAVYGYIYGKQRQLVRNEDEYQDEQLMDEIQRDFSLGRLDAFLVVELDNLFTSEGATMVRQMVAAVEELEYVAGVTWLDTVETMNVFGLSDPLLPNADASQEKFEIARERVMDNPLVKRQLISDDGKTLLMPIEFDWFEITSNEDCLEGVLEAARGAVPAESLRIRVTGKVPLFVASNAAFQRNKRFFQIMSHVLIIGIAIIVFRGWSAIFVVASAPVVAIFWSLGILKLIQDQANPLTDAILPVLISMVALTDGVHLMVHIRRRRILGDSPVDATRSAVAHVGVACALTSLTTAIGFASLMLAQSEFVRGFGQSCAIGVGLGFLSVVTIIPLLATTWLGNNIQQGQDKDWVGQGLNRFHGVFDWVVGHYRLVGSLGILLTLGLTMVALSLRPDDRTFDSQPTGSEAYAALMHCDRELGGIETIRVVIKWPEALDPRDSKIVDAVADVEAIVRDESMLSLSVSVRSLLESFPGDNAVNQRLPFIDLMPDELRDALYNADERTTLVTARLRDLGIAIYRPVFASLESRFVELQKKYPGFRFELTGRPIIRGRRLHQMVTDLARSLGTASLVIFVVMTLVYRSLRIGLITIIPNMFPLVVTATFLYLTNRPLDIAAVCAFTVCLGIAVDDTIHFLTRFRSEQLAGRSEVDAARKSFQDVGSALIMTTIILVAGFGIVVFSELPRQRDFSTMACVTITAALLGDLIFLPALLVWGAKTRRPMSQESDG